MSADSVKKLLFIAYHFPPIQHSSGVHRTLKFVRYLREHDWLPLVLTVKPAAYASKGTDLIDEVPLDVEVARAFALDAARHLSLGGSYPKFLANPDRWASWAPFAERLGRRIIRRQRPQAIVSTYPISTAHLIGLHLARWSGLPWVADFRDSMVDPDYPRDPRQRLIHQRLERKTLAQCDRAIFTTPSAISMYQARYPELPKRRWAMIPNGFDENDFRGIPTMQARHHNRGEKLVLLHSGVLYPVERDPMPFFRALARLRSEGRIGADRLEIRLRATAHERQFAPKLRELGIEDLVALAQPLAYREALREMTEADALLIFQAESCDHQIPAKLYEYLRAQQPIIALTSFGGDTAAVLRDAGADNILPIDDENELVRMLPGVLSDLENGTLKVAPGDLVDSYSRERQASELAKLLDDLIEPES